MKSMKISADNIWIGYVIKLSLKFRFEILKNSQKFSGIVNKKKREEHLEYLLF